MKRITELLSFAFDFDSTFGEKKSIVGSGCRSGLTVLKEGKKKRREKKRAY